MQRALARLLTDDALRARFLANPVRACEELGLEESDAQQVARMAPGRLRLAGRSLQHKRLQDARRLLPATAVALGPRFDALFLDHARLRPMQPAQTIHHDVETFAGQLLEAMRRESTDRRTRETAEYETCWLRASYPRPTLIVRRFVSVSFPGMRAPGTLAIWLRLTAGGEIHHRVMSCPRWWPPFLRARPEAAGRDHVSADARFPIINP